MAIVEIAEKIVKLVAIEPISAVRILALSANEIDPDDPICHASLALGSQVARTNIAAPTHMASKR